MEALYIQPKTVERSIPTDNKEIKRYICFLTLKGIRYISPTKVNINGLTFAVGSVFWKFQSLNPTDKYTLITTCK